MYLELEWLIFQAVGRNADFEQSSSAQNGTKKNQERK